MTTVENDSQRTERIVRERQAVQYAARAAEARSLWFLRERLGRTLRTSSDRADEAEAAFATAVDMSEDVDALHSLAETAIVARHVFVAIKARHEPLVFHPSLKFYQPEELRPPETVPL